jgi:formylglycine-generating enzyme required for sulfatase activity
VTSPGALPDREAPSEPETDAAVIPREEPPPEVPGFRFLAPNRQGLQEYRHEATGIVMVLIPGGTFHMGSTGEEREEVETLMDRFIEHAKSRVYFKAALKTEAPRHEVTLDSYLIAKHEVRQDIWKRVMGANPSRFQGEDLPVENVSWNDASEFCRRTGLLLPTEAQWEHAARAGTEGPFSTGPTISPEEANFNGTYPYGGPKGAYRKRTLPSGALPPNGFGLHAVHGNVAEWCADVFDEAFYARPEATKRNPVLEAPPGPAPRVLRGGSWALHSWAARSAARDAGLPDKPHHLRGLRPAYGPMR